VGQIGSPEAENLPILGTLVVMVAQIGSPGASPPLGTGQTVPAR